MRGITLGWTAYKRGCGRGYCGAGAVGCFFFEVNAAPAGLHMTAVRISPAKRKPPSGYDVRACFQAGTELSRKEQRTD